MTDPTGGKPGPRPKVDWDALEPHYRAGVRPVATIAAEFGCSDVAVVKHAKKFGWTRNLKAKIEAKAQAKIAAALVAETNPQARMSEALRVEVEAEVQARILQAQRADIVRYRGLGMQMFAELEMQTTDPQVLYKLAAQAVGESPDDPPELRKQREADRIMREDLIGKAVSLPSRVSSFKTMADALRIVVLLQRQAIGLNSDDAAPDQGTRGGVVYRANMPQRGIVEGNP